MTDDIAAKAHDLETRLNRIYTEMLWIGGELDVYEASRLKVQLRDMYEHFVGVYIDRKREYLEDEELLQEQDHD